MVAPGGLVAEDPARPLAAPSWKVLPMPTVMYPRSLKYSGIVVKFPEVFRQSGGEREANAGSAQSRVANGFKRAAVTAVRVKYTVGRRVPTGEDRRTRRPAGGHGHLTASRREDVKIMGALASGVRA